MMKVALNMRPTVAFLEIPKRHRVACDCVRCEWGTVMKCHRKGCMICMSGTKTFVVLF